MKALIISDIHSNFEALHTVAKTNSFDEVWCLGDLVDYGPQTHRSCAVGPASRRSRRARQSRSRHGLPNRMRLLGEISRSLRGFSGNEPALVDG